MTAVTLDIEYVMAGSDVEHKAQHAEDGYILTEHNLSDTGQL